MSKKTSKSSFTKKFTKKLATRPAFNKRNLNTFFHTLKKEKALEQLIANNTELQEEFNKSHKHGNSNSENGADPLNSHNNPVGQQIKHPQTHNTQNQQPPSHTTPTAAPNIIYQPQIFNQNHNYSVHNNQSSYHDKQQIQMNAWQLPNHQTQNVFAHPPDPSVDGLGSMTQIGFATNHLNTSNYTCPFNNAVPEFARAQPDLPINYNVNSPQLIGSIGSYVGPSQESCSMDSASSYINYANPYPSYDQQLQAPYGVQTRNMQQKLTPNVPTYTIKDLPLLSEEESSEADSEDDPDFDGQEKSFLSVSSAGHLSEEVSRDEEEEEVSTQVSEDEATSCPDLPENSDEMKLNSEAESSEDLDQPKSNLPAVFQNTEAEKEKQRSCETPNFNRTTRRTQPELDWHQILPESMAAINKIDPYETGSSFNGSGHNSPAFDPKLGSNQGPKSMFARSLASSPVNLPHSISINSMESQNSIRTMETIPEEKEPLPKSNRESAFLNQKSPAVKENETAPSSIQTETSLVLKDEDEIWQEFLMELEADQLGLNLSASQNSANDSQKTSEETKNQKISDIKKNLQQMPENETANHEPEKPKIFGHQPVIYDIDQITEEYRKSYL